MHVRILLIFISSAILLQIVDQIWLEDSSLPTTGQDVLHFRPHLQLGWRMGKTLLFWSPLNHLAALGLGVSMYWMKNLRWGVRKQNTQFWKSVSTKLSKQILDSVFFFFSVSTIQLSGFFSSRSRTLSVSLYFTPKVLNFCLFF